MNKVLVINPGSTSTKIAVFEDDKQIFAETLRHSNEELKDFAETMDQVDFRKEAIEKVLKEKNFDITTLNAISARGGQVPPCAAGTYKVDKGLVDYSLALKGGIHASNLGCVVAYKLAEPLGIPAFIVDPVAVDEMIDVARITGIPDINRVMQGHALNCRAMAINCAEKLGKKLEDCNFIVMHLGGGGSIRLFVKGRMIDHNSDDETYFAPERCGGANSRALIELCYSGKYTHAQMQKIGMGKGGLLAHLGTSNAIEVEKRITEGDEKAKLVYEGMLYSVSKAIGALAAAADGKIDRIILTGGLSHSKYVTDYISKKVSFIAPVEIMAGEFELEALAAGACRVLTGKEEAKGFTF